MSKYFCRVGEDKFDFSSPHLKRRRKQKSPSSINTKYRFVCYAEVLFLGSSSKIAHSENEDVTSQINRDGSPAVIDNYEVLHEIASFTTNIHEMSSTSTEQVQHQHC